MDNDPDRMTVREFVDLYDMAPIELCEAYHKWKCWVSDPHNVCARVVGEIERRCSLPPAPPAPPADDLHSSMMVVPPWKSPPPADETSTSGNRPGVDRPGTVRPSEQERGQSTRTPPAGCLPDAEAVRLAEILETEAMGFGSKSRTGNMIRDAAAMIRRLSDGRDSWQKRALEAELELAEVSSQLASCHPEAK